MPGTSDLVRIRAEICTNSFRYGWMKLAVDNTR
jgi:hypothetical protein